MTDKTRQLSLIAFDGQFVTTAPKYYVVMKNGRTCYREGGYTPGEKMYCVYFCKHYADRFADKVGGDVYSIQAFYHPDVDRTARTAADLTEIEHEIIGRQAELEFGF